MHISVVCKEYGWCFKIFAAKITPVKIKPCGPEKMLWCGRTWVFIAWNAYLEILCWM